MLTLVIGGAGSGKSAFAEALVCRRNGKKLYLATMLPHGAEALTRIEKHRAQRAGRGFETLERGLDLEHAAIPAGADILLEDLSNLLANEIFDPAGGGVDAVRRGIEHLISESDNLTVVTNEIFSDGADYEIFSDGADYDVESLRYMRLLAELNREIAARADLAVELVCGLPNVLKGELP